ncbi:DNA replication licensing factor MCM3 [Tetranychus urticae]|uniref:DNA replication licensing factor MCM3 n=1 Tax=Tetranychus urticae TaxID=32264 RepID=T1K879_TETUR|nr:DNA replication licensing factor MCM3 [Tetranychus urticae]
MAEFYKEYLDFLDDESDHGIYYRLVKEMIAHNEMRLIVNINDLRKKNPVRAKALLTCAFEELLSFERALRDFTLTIDQEYLKKVPDLFIGLEGSFGNKHVTPRSLTSSYLGQIVCVEGIVTKCSLVRPKVIKSVHYCPVTKKVMERKYTDLTSYDAFPSSTVYPTKDEDGNLLETEFGLSTYKDHQTFTIQEMPEKAPAGQLPRSVDIIADNDLVDKCKPGDRVQVIGVFRCLPSKQGNYSSGTFRTVLLANNIELLSKEVAPSISAEDVQKCRSFSRQRNKNVFEELARSLAPSIHGHEYIKKALLCMLLGGVEKNLPNGTRLRGDINILLVGDPSVAKSQMLRYVLHTAPRAIATTGRGSSGVGLTAAVTNDFETGERRLEAGAMVLADRGVVCIDEFDKMSDIDRTAIHEVMEQGRVTITKAGIHAKLNARCSVLAAANPVYGRYDEYKNPMDNIGLQDSLLSRFDLLFILLDKHDRDLDTAIADHVVRIHRYRAPNEEDGEPLPIISSADFLSTKNLETIDEEEGDTPIYEKYDNLLHANRSKSEKIVSVQFMKKYIHIAKSMKPVLTQEACEKISEAYSKLRCYDQEHADLAKTQPVTARSLETLIRLSTAHAKARLSRIVEARDADAAIELIQFAIFKKVYDKPKKRRRDEEEGEESGDGSDVEVDSETDEVVPVSERSRAAKRKERLSSEEKDEPTQREPKVKKPRSKSTKHESQEMETDDSSRAEPSGETSGETSSAMTTQIEVEINETRLKKFKKMLMNEFRKSHAQSLPISAIKEVFCKDGDDSWSSIEVDACLNRMQDDNNIMITESVVFII